jgi:hypothetical protein
MQRKSKFAAHLLDNNHPMGKIKEVMDVVYKTREGNHMNTMEKFYIYYETSQGN